MLVVKFFAFIFLIFFELLIAKEQNVSIEELKLKIIKNEKKLKRLQNIIGELKQQFYLVEKSLPPEYLLDSISKEQKKK